MNSTLTLAICKGYMAGRGGPSAPIRARWGDVERPLRRRLEIDLDTVTYAGLISFNESTAMFVVFFERRRHHQPVSSLSQGNRMVEIGRAHV